MFMVDHQQRLAKANAAVQVAINKVKKTPFRLGYMFECPDFFELTGKQLSGNNCAIFFKGMFC